MIGRRIFLAGGICLLTAGAGLADGLADKVVRALKKQGYAQIRISRTWLGRTRINASDATRTREIVLNPRTGEILRDYWQDKNGDTGISVIDIENRDHSHGGNSGRGDSGGSGSGDGSGSGSPGNDHGGSDHGRSNSGSGGGSDGGSGHGSDSGSSDRGSQGRGSDAGSHGGSDGSSDGGEDD